MVGDRIHQLINYTTKFRRVICNAHSCGETFVQVELQFTLPVSKSQLTVRPNPTSGLTTCVLTRSPDLSSATKYTHTDPQGRVVLQGSGASEIITLDLSLLSPAVYSLKVCVGEHSCEQNIIKQ